VLRQDFAVMLDVDIREDGLHGLRRPHRRGNNFLDDAKQHKSRSFSPSFIYDVNCFTP
jgi:hypothetical protein